MAADDCQCLVYDSSAFGAAGSTVHHVAAGKIGSPASGAAVTAMAWHHSGVVLIGMSSGGALNNKGKKLPCCALATEIAYAEMVVVINDVPAVWLQHHVNVCLDAPHATQARWLPCSH